jgi:hypothetical protein
MSDRRIYRRAHKNAPIRHALAIAAFALYVVGVLQLIAVIRVQLHPKAELLVLAPTDEIAQTFSE